MSLDLTLDAGEEMRFLNKVSRLVRRLEKKTHFTHRELEVCLLIYYKLTKDEEDNKGHVSRHQLDVLFDSVFGISDSETVGRICTALDKSVTTFMSMESWVKMLSLFLKGTFDEKIEHCFRAYDIGGEELLRREHMMILLRSCFIKHQEEEVEESVKDMVEILIRRMDVDRDGAISLDDFRQSVHKSPELLECFGQALPDRAHVYAFSKTFLDQSAEF
ncbi:AAEL002275-PA [Aedes aegypti]|uniref:AAEL002275-PA n=2 Tax=Aedes aegypti TaxID=7159 RepID=A0A1S4F174_AEDAE|nr:EF-hand calcium-binding domain-containing protein 1 [Aedes aegypti]EAT46551.1 AAEL002275-PA [Aedes aegypti]